MANKKKKRETVAALPKRAVDIHFEQLAHDYRNPANRVIQAIGIPVFSFALLGLIWMIPFPEIAFLTKHGYDIFLNWGSFFIAAMIYYYLRLAPTLSYGVLLFVGIFSFFIVQLEYIEKDGGPAVWLVCSILLLISLLALYAGKTFEKPSVSLRGFFKLLLLGPIWLLHFLFRKLQLPY